jgi:hypothetical protein
MLPLNTVLMYNLHLFIGAGDGSQGLVQSKHVLHHWAAALAPELSSYVGTLITFPVSIFPCNHYSDHQQTGHLYHPQNVLSYSFPVNILHLSHPEVVTIVTHMISFI